MFKESLPTRTPFKGYDPIILTDLYIECSEVVERFLDLIYPGSHDLVYPNLSVNLNDGLLNRRVICLAREWECRYVLDRITKELQISTR